MSSGVSSHSRACLGITAEDKRVLVVSDSCRFSPREKQAWLVVGFIKCGSPPDLMHGRAAFTLFSLS